MKAGTSLRAEAVNNALARAIWFDIGTTIYPAQGTRYDQAAAPRVRSHMPDRLTRIRVAANRGKVRSAPYVTSA
jgi:hypothetical protein